MLQWIKHRVFSIHPIIPRSNLDFVLFVSGLVYSLIIAALFTNEALGGRSVPFLVALTFLFIIGTHGVHALTLYFYKLALDKRREEKTDEYKITIWRYGEIIGFALINYIVFLTPLFMLGIIPKMPEQSLTVVDGLAGILVGTSLWKMYSGQIPRVRYNNLFFLTALTTTICILLAISIGAVIGKHVPPDIIVIQFTIFICYVCHDRLLEITDPEECNDPTHDYLIMGLVTIWGAFIFAFSAFVNEIPIVEAAGMVIGTVGITLVSEEIKRRIIKKNEEKTETRPKPEDEIHPKIKEAEEELQGIEEDKKEEKEKEKKEKEQEEKEPGEQGESVETPEENKKGLNLFSYRPF